MPWCWDCPDCPSTISRYLPSLEEQGLVQRTADPDDGRAQRICITTLGVGVITRVLGHRAATIHEAISHWPEGDRSELHELLRRLADDLSQVTEPCIPPAAVEAARTETRVKNP